VLDPTMKLTFIWQVLSSMSRKIQFRI
jgi:hypothetical protein